MNLAALSSQEFGKIVKLLTERKQLIAQVKVIEKKIASLGGIAPASPKRKKKASKAKRQTMKDVVLQVLAKAPAKGLSVSEIVKLTKRPQASLSVWFYTAAKKIKGLKRVAPGRFIYRAQLAFDCN